MNGSEGSRRTTDGGRLLCGCGLPLVFGVDAGDNVEPQRLRHADGTPICIAEDRNLVPASVPLLPVVSGESPPSRRALAEARLLAEIDAAESDRGDRRASMLGVMLLYALVVTLVAVCAVIVVSNWPSN